MKIKNIIFVALGFLFLGLGALGIVLPLLPTTPLLLLASYFFVKGSKKFEVWFKGTSIYKKHLDDFVKNRSLTIKKKIIISLFSDSMILITFLFTESTIVRVILILVVAYKYYYFIAKIKTV
ncbi:YbaN family protein [Fictibacillus barbaricus]|uniref:YbaN family protein n=1 Tax=Fictibacillus barbaricus TaxID=182136 RepID=A0ABS2Z8A9_9BACL|nr:YbaN family protein [Fictibacillus barbaricus]MBN3544364.1 YbaN family protein [Fictibacillus barbaricus]GGB67439.1 hypothetical protein GCM10007199_37000 [Fictibacillus barbaricus]